MNQELNIDKIIAWTTEIRLTEHEILRQSIEDRRTQLDQAQEEIRKLRQEIVLLQLKENKSCGLMGRVPPCAHRQRD